MRIPIDWRAIVDFIILTGTLYIVLRWASRARALRIALAVTALYAGVLVARQFDLVITAWILQGAALITIALLVIVFQPEVRRALVQLDRSLLVRRYHGESLDRSLAESAFQMASARVGALFAIVRRDPILDLIDTGVVLNADISEPLIESIFNKYSPLHDGAVVIEGARISRAGAVLPLTLQEDVPAEFGTRHRAAMGLAERSDAICLVVSEERGDVSIMNGRTIVRMQSVEALARYLENSVARQPVKLPHRVRDLLLAHARLKFAAAGLAALIWSVTLFDTGSTVRLVEVPVEFQNVPLGLDVSDPSASEVSVQLRGRTWMMNSNQVNGLIARVDLSGAHEGFKTIAVSSRALNLPPGVRVMRVEPSTIQLRLIKRVVRR